MSETNEKKEIAENPVVLPGLKKEDFLKELSSKLAGYVIDSLSHNLKKTKDMLDELEHSSRDNKDALLSKYVAMIDILEKTLDNNQRMIAIQDKLIGLEKEREKLSEEIQKLLIQ